MTPAEFRIGEDDGLLYARCAAASLNESRPLADADYKQFEAWSLAYRGLLGRDDAAALLALGRQMYHWLNGAHKWLAKIRPCLVPPAVVEFAVRWNPSPRELAFLEAPWELLADDADHLARAAPVAFCPVRRFGKPTAPPPPSEFRLSTVFMAAAPPGAVQLRYEEEESALLKAAARIGGMDLTVEESGSLPLLVETLAREEETREGRVDVLHISCHGSASPPSLLLEDETGARSDTPAAKLAMELSAHCPRLLFVSACETAAADKVLNSLSATLILNGLPAVLGWGGSVRDVEATRFAGHLYRRLSNKEPLADAVARARVELANPAAGSVQPSSRDWHLARLYFGPAGGGKLCGGSKARGLLKPEAAYKAYLDPDREAADRVPVAGLYEFVGRRRQIQRILAEFRSPTKAGVFVHGFGRHGKSSLAARIGYRLKDHDRVVLFGRYTAAAVLDKFKAVIGTAEVAGIVKQYRDAVEADPNALDVALRELLKGPCREVERDESGKVIRRPVLLVVDDFEQVLEPAPVDSSGPHRLKSPALADSVRAIILAFRESDTRSRLLFTSRHTFTLPHEGHDYGQDLLDLHLKPMDESESEKQASAKEKADPTPGGTAPHPARVERVIEAARGNPGLQDLLFTLALKDPAACDRAVAEMNAYLAGGKDPENEKVRAFLENLAVVKVMDLLAPGERELLRLSTLFDLPVPMETFNRLSREAAIGEGEGATRRLLGLGLWDLYEDLVRPTTRAAAVNPLVRRRAGEVSEPDRPVLIRLILPDLFDRWGGSGRYARPYSVDYQLARLAVTAGDAAVLSATAVDAIRWLAAKGEHRAAAELGRGAFAAMEKANVDVSFALFRVAGEQSEIVGDVSSAGTFFDRAIALIEAAQQRGDKAEPEAHAGVYKAQAGRLVREGRPDEAIALLRRAEALLVGDPFRRGRAIISGAIARILAGKGEVDEALRLHRERLAVYEALGDRRERAVALGDVARILRNKGEVDEALRLHREQVVAFEALGDRRSRAVALGDVARILRNKGEVDEALRLHREQVAEFETLGDRRARAIALGDVARILTDKGEVDEALRLHRAEVVEYEALGDRRSRAVALGDVARILRNKGEVDEALRLHREQVVAFEALGDRRERAVALGDVARILTDKGEVDEALRLHREQVVAFEALGDRRERAVALGDVARILTDKGEVDEALRLHRERLDVQRALADVFEIAAALWDIAQIELSRDDYQPALEHLIESYGIFLKIGRLEGVAVIGSTLGQLMCAAGAKEQGLAVLARARDGYLKLGRPQSAARVQAAIDHFSKAAE